MLIGSSIRRTLRCPRFSSLVFAPADPWSPSIPPHTPSRYASNSSDTDGTHSPGHLDHENDNVFAEILRIKDRDSKLGIHARDRGRTKPSPLQHQGWISLFQQGAVLNPCNSPFHPAVKEAGLTVGGDAIPVQDAYTPHSSCFGCGPEHPDGLRIKSYRIADGLEARVTLPQKYSAFPGVISGGILSTIFDCHGNWTAGLALMDEACLTKPVLTMTVRLDTQFKSPASPGQPLIIKSRVLRIQHPGDEADDGRVRSKDAVDVAMEIAHVTRTNATQIIARCEGTFKKHGAMRVF